MATRTTVLFLPIRWLIKRYDLFLLLFISSVLSQRSVVQRDTKEKFPVFVTGVNGTKTTKLNQQCLWALNWPNVVYAVCLPFPKWFFLIYFVFSLGNTQREDAVFIAFQFWVLGVSIVALLNESIPHILASLLTHVMATAWGAFQIKHTADFRADFKRVITDSACKRAILSPSYWKTRSYLEIPSLTFNGLALIISCCLTWNLIKVLGFIG